MLRVARTDERLAALAKPVLQRTAQFRLEADDCLVACAGFEDRALGVLKNAVVAGNNFTVIMINYLPFVGENRSTEMRDLCQQARLRTIEATYDQQNPAGFGTVLKEKIAGTKGRIFLDVSAMSRLLIVQNLVALGKRDSGFEDCVVVYAEATSYPTEEEVEQELRQSVEDPLHSILLLSSGVFDVTVVPELSSIAISGDQTRLVAFPTFSTDQLTSLRNELAPSRLTCIHGVPPSPENQWRIAAIARINQLDRGGLIPPDNLLASTLDYRETLKCLLELYEAHSERERILISPTGSKMQTVAAGLFRTFMDDVQIVYPTPQEFRSPSSYTKGIAQLYSLALNDFVLR